MKTLALALAATLALAGAASAQANPVAATAAATPAATPAVQGIGVVRSINVKAGTITLAHGPITALKWPAMTMPFKVSDPALLKTVAVGAKVRFQLQGQKIVAIDKL